MGKQKNEGKIGVSLGAELLARCDAAIEKANARNRSDFIREAVEHYLAVLNAQENSKVLTPALESVINSRIALSEYRISQMLYKLAVEIAMTNYIHTEDVYSDVRYHALSAWFSPALFSSCRYWILGTKKGHFFFSEEMS